MSIQISEAVAILEQAAYDHGFAAATEQDGRVYGTLSAEEWKSKRDEARLVLLGLFPPKCDVSRGQLMHRWSNYDDSIDAHGHYRATCRRCGLVRVLFEVGVGRFRYEYQGRVIRDWSSKAPRLSCSPREEDVAS